MKKLGYAFLSLLVLIGCNKPPEQTDFDRGAMLTNMSTSIIDPAYSALGASLGHLKADANAFVQSASITTLNQLKSTFNQTYLDFEACKMFNFGAIEDYAIVTAMNTYPTDTTKIASNISSGTYTLGALENFQAIGLPAIDYLLFHADELEIISEFTIDLEANNRKSYLIDLCNKMDEEFDLALSGWENSKLDFAAADGNDVGSSTSLLFNAFVKDIELVKNAKIGIPAGFQTAGEILPHYIETYFSEQSITLAVANLTALQNLFNGKDGLGFDDYIRDVEDNSVENSLADQINAQFELCISKINAIESPLSEKVNSDHATVTEAYNEVKTLVTYVKTDMSSILGLLITFQDNDGD
ncbi:MAG: imelysin family protein [Crocinitomicaceae bacterium]